MSTKCACLCDCCHEAGTDDELTCSWCDGDLHWPFNAAEDYAPLSQTFDVPRPQSHYLSCVIAGAVLALLVVWVLNLGIMPGLR